MTFDLFAQIFSAFLMGSLATLIAVRWKLSRLVKKRLSEPNQTRLLEPPVSAELAASSLFTAQMKAQYDLYGIPFPDTKEEDLYRWMQ